MAISGSGGWIPSCGVALRNGRVIWVGYTQNKPKSSVCQDLEEAVFLILDGETVQYDMRAGRAHELLSRIYHELSKDRDEPVPALATTEDPYVR